MFLLALCLLSMSLSFSQSVALSEKYYCPHYEDVLLGQTCYRPLKDVLNRNAAQLLCTSLNKELLEKSVDQISGWLEDTASIRELVTEDYCVYAFPEPVGVASPDNPLYKLGPCSTRLQVMCSRVLDTGSNCESGWIEAATSTQSHKYCVKPYGIESAEQLSENSCPQDSTVFDFNYQNPDDDLTYTTTDESLPMLLTPFWTPYYLQKTGSGSKTVHRLTKVEARPLEFCFYKYANTEVMMMSCEKELPFHCQSPAKLTADDQYIDPDPYDSEQNYSCEQDEIICENKCYKHRKVYKTLDKASANCTEGGYKLVARNVPCINYQSGWVEGSFEDGRLDVNSSLSLDSLCVYVEKGEKKLGDCRWKATGLCQVTLKSPDEACPAGYTKCSETTRTCVGESRSDVALSWNEAVRGLHVCNNGGTLIDSRSSLEDCKASVPKHVALWVGASLSKGNVVEFSSGEEVTISTPKKCLRVSGGKLMTSDCDDHRYFACERLAKVAESESSSADTAIVVTLILSPLVLVGAVLLLLYKKKGKQMCFSDTTADIEPADTGLTITNPIAEEGQVKIETVDLEDRTKAGASGEVIGNVYTNNTDI